MEPLFLTKKNATSNEVTFFYILFEAKRTV